MKNIFAITILVIAGAWVMYGNQTDAQTASVDISIKLSEVQEATNVLRYDLKVGEFTYHFWSREQLEAFANTIDEDDPEETALVRKVLRQELKRYTIGALTSDLEKGIRTYSVTKEIITTR